MRALYPRIPAPRNALPDGQVQIVDRGGVAASRSDRGRTSTAVLASIGEAQASPKPEAPQKRRDTIRRGRGCIERFTRVAVRSPGKRFPF